MAGDDNKRHGGRVCGKFTNGAIVRRGGMCYNDREAGKSAAWTDFAKN